MNCCNNYANNCATNRANTCAAANDSCCGTGGGGFSCIINLIIILVVLQFLTQIICGLQCDQC